MTKNILFTVLKKLINISRKTKKKLVLMGGIAFSILVRPRSTYDIDGIISLKAEELEEFLALIKKSGFKFDSKEPVKSIRGFSFLTFYYPPYKTYVDLFMAKNEFQYEILTRAKRVKWKKLNLYIISPEDLILIKLQTGREKDLEDIREIILENRAKIDFGYLRRWSKILNVDTFLRDEMRSLWRKR